MIKLIRRWVKNLLWNEQTAAASIRSFITFIAATGGFITASATDAQGHVNFEILSDWNLKAWLIRAAFGALAAAAVRIPSSSLAKPASEDVKL